MPNGETAALVGLAVLLAQLIGKLIDAFIDKKKGTNGGYFSEADRAKLDANCDSLRDLNKNIESHTEAVRGLAMETKLANTQQATLAQARSERDRDLFDLMRQVLNKISHQ